MNLLDNTKILLSSGLVFLLIPFFFACDDPGELGIRVSPNDQSISVKDTSFAMNISTILIDSLRTNEFANILVGNSEDSVTGNVQCVPYAQYSVASGTFPADTLEFVSAYMSFHINEVRTTDNILSGHIDVHESTDTLYSEVVYLADRNVAYNPTPVSQVDYNINIDQDSALNIPLNGIGEKLFSQMVKYDADTVFKDSVQRSLIHYPALVLNTTSSNSGLMSLSLSNDSSAIFIEMKSPTTDSTYYFRARFSGRGHFTHIDRDKTGSKLSSLTEAYVSEFKTGSAYGSMVDGTYLMLDLAPLKSFIAENPQLIVNNARLELSTTDYGSEFIVPFSSVRFFYIRNGKINGPGAITANSRYFSSILSDISYATSGNEYLSMVHDNDAAQYTGQISLFTQLLSDDRLGIDVDKVVVLNPVPTSLKKSIFTKAEVVIYYTVIK